MEPVRNLDSLPSEEDNTADIASAWEQAMDEVIENEQYEDTAEDESRLQVITNSFGDTPTVIRSPPSGNIPLINMDSSMDSGRDNKSDTFEGDTPLLEVAASSSSKGSQGSYADQVPALSTSLSNQQNDAETNLESPWALLDDDLKRSPPNSSHHRSLEVEEDRKENTTQEGITQKTLGGTNSQRESENAHSAISVIDTAGRTEQSQVKDASHRVEQQKFGATESGDVLDILGPNDQKYSEDLDDILGPKGLLSTQPPNMGVVSSVTERPVPAANSNANVSEQPTEECTKPMPDSKSCPPTATQQGIENSFSNQMASKGKRTFPSQDPFSSPATSPAEDSLLNRIYASLEDYEQKQNNNKTRPPTAPNCPPRRQFIGPASSNVSKGSTFESDSSFQTSSSHTRVSGVSGSTDEVDSSWADTTEYSKTTYTLSNTLGSQTDTLSPTYSSTDPMSTTSGTLSPSTFSAVAGSMSQTASEGSETEREREEKIKAATSAQATNPVEPTEGGRLWEMASLEAQSANLTTPRSPEAARFAESLMARTRSRADTGNVVSASSSDTSDRVPVKSNMIKVGELHDEKFIVNTALARKRVRVVQLLTVGLVGLLVAFGGSLWVHSSCHFLSVDVEVGERSQLFELHFGLWKYTPIESVFQGYAFCSEYDDEYTDDAPFIARWAGFIALLSGAYSLGVLWFYLIIGHGTKFTWNAAVFLGTVAGVCQLSTLVIFTGSVCSRDTCILGPAGILSIIAGCVYFVLAFEMHYNSPIQSWIDDIPNVPSIEKPNNLVGTLEMTDFRDGATAYVRRIVDGKGDHAFPTLNQFQRENVNPIGEAMLERQYKPPAIV